MRLRATRLGAIGGAGDFFDPDAWAYISAVEAADAQTLEDGVKAAINSFIVGCKTDGIWSAIKACCIMAGARTLSGALTPLVGPAPTNFNFVAGDYNRKTGLVGDGSTKYLDSNRNNNADPQNSKHLSVYITQVATSGSVNYPVYIGFSSQPGWSVIFRGNNNGSVQMAINLQGPRQIVASTTGFIGVSRSSSTSVTSRSGGVDLVSNLTSQTSADSLIYIHADTIVGNYSNGRIAFYSIGEAIDLALLDARVTTLRNALAAAIP